MMLAVHEVQPPTDGRQLAIRPRLDKHVPAMGAAFQLPHVLGSVMARKRNTHAACTIEAIEYPAGGIPAS